MKKLFILLSVAVLGAFIVPQKPSLPGTISVDGKLFTSLYQQHAAEYKALCFQAYNIARLRVDASLQSSSTKTSAVITDIDETVLDNSPFAAHQALQGKEFEFAAWLDWTSKALCDTLPGALTFFKYAASKKIEVFYVTNRDEKEREATLKNLQKYGFPNADNNHLILKQGTSSKEARRQTIAATHNIVLFLGDNLSDFSGLFDKKNMSERLTETKQVAAEFGNKFIVLPNPDYGDWEGALYQYNYKLSAAQKDSVIKSNLKSY